MRHFKLLSKTKVGVLLAVSVALVGVGLLQRTWAAAGQLYVSPSTASVQNGNSTTVSVRLNPGTAVDGVEATVTFDTSKLQFVSVDASSSPFTIQLLQSTSGGTIQISRGILGSTVSSDALVAKVTFKALAGSGTTKINVSGNATSGGAYTNPAAGSATLTLTTPVTATPTPTQPKPSTGTSNPPTSGSAPKPSSGGSTSTPNTSTSGGQNTAGGEKPVSQAGKVEICDQRVELTRVILCVSANKRVRVYIKYGSDANQLRISTAMTKLASKHDVNLGTQYLVPGTTYYYQIVAVDEQGNKTVSEVQSLKTKGYRVQLHIVDKSERPLRKKKVTFFSDPMTGTTDEEGNVTFADVAPGKHHVEYVQGDQKYSQEVTVEDTIIKTAADGTQTAEPATYQAAFQNLAAVDYSPSLVLPASIAAGILAVAVVALLVVRKKQHAQQFAVSPGMTTPPIVGPIPPTPPNEDPLQRAPGVEKPNPGSVVAPRPQDDDKDQR